MTDAAAPPTDTATIEALRRVKAVEAEWEGKLADARAANETLVQRARDEAEATVKAVQAEVEAERSRRLEQARADADREAETIRANGEKEAAAVRSGKGKRPADRADEIVDAVLGPFAHD